MEQFDQRLRAMAEKEECIVPKGFDERLENVLDELPPHYEVELKTAWGEFDYMVDAFTGEVLSGPKDVLNIRADTPVTPDPALTTPDTTPPAENNVWQNPGNADVVSGTAIDQETAKKAALDHAGLAAGDVANWKIERDWDDGRLEYEVEFDVGRTEYEYTIDGVTGAILEYEQDID